MKSTEFACKPEFGETQLQYSASVGGQVNLECAVVGDPRPRVSWQLRLGNSTGAPVTLAAAGRRRFNVRDSGRLTVHTLTISDVRPDDFGSYLCVAENPADKVLNLLQLDSDDTGNDVRLTLKRAESDSVGGAFERLPLEALVGLTALIAVLVTGCVCVTVLCRQRANERKLDSHATANGCSYVPVDKGNARAGTHLRVTFDDAGFNDADDSGYLDSSEPSPHSVAIAAKNSPLPPNLPPANRAPIVQLYEDKDQFPLKETAL